jgi:hypothetical protein
MSGESTGRYFTKSASAYSSVALGVDIISRLQGLDRETITATKLCQCLASLVALSFGRLMAMCRQTIRTLLLAGNYFFSLAVKNCLLICSALCSNSSCWNALHNRDSKYYRKATRLPALTLEQTPVLAVKWITRGESHRAVLRFKCK